MSTLASRSFFAPSIASLLAAAVLAAGCTTTAAPPVDLNAAAQALRAGETHSLAFEASGQWYQFGQAPAPGLPWPAFSLSRYSAQFDYAQPAARVQLVRKQVVEPGRVRPAPVEQRADQFVAGTLAWNQPVAAANAQPAAPQPQPAAVAERQAEIWSTPQGFLRAALAQRASTRATADGTEVRFNAGTARYVGWLNARGEVERVLTSVATPVLGDTTIETRFADYRSFDGLPFPARITRSQGGHPVLDLTVGSVQRNAPVAIAVPAAVASAAPAPVTVTANKLADGVHYLTGGSHHSVAVEQADHWVLIEAPQHRERAEALLAKLKELAPAKPVRYVVNTHVHFDHAGGLPALVDAGAIVVTHAANKPYFEAAWSKGAGLAPVSRAPRFETFTDKHVLSDGKRTIELHALRGNGHNDAFAVAFLPAEKLLVQADAYTPAAADAAQPAAPNPYTVNLYENVQRLKLDVAQVAPLHGRLVTIADLRAAAGARATTAAAEPAR